LKKARKRKKTLKRKRKIIEAGEAGLDIPAGLMNTELVKATAMLAVVVLPLAVMAAELEPVVEPAEVEEVNLH
jgi:hypothetical protein